MFKTPQNEVVSNWMTSNYYKKIEQDKAFETGQQQPYYLPTSIRLGPFNNAVVDGTARYHSFTGGLMEACCTGCGEGKECSGGAFANYSRFVGGQGIRSLNGVEPSKAAGTQSYTTATPAEMKVGGFGPSSVVDMTDQIRGRINPLMMAPVQDKEPETLAGVRRVHGGRRKMTDEEKKAWGEMMKKARAKKRGGKKEKSSEIHIDINSHKNEPNDDEKKSRAGAGSITNFAGKLLGINTENPLDVMKRASETILKKDSTLGKIVRNVGSDVAKSFLKSAGFGGAKVYKKGSNKKLNGGIAPVNTFTAKSSPVISGKGKKGGKKQWTQEERKAFAEKMKAAKAAKKINK